MAELLMKLLNRTRFALLVPRSHRHWHQFLLPLPYTGLAFSSYLMPLTIGRKTGMKPEPNSPSIRLPLPHTLEINSE